MTWSPRAGDAKARPHPAARAAALGLVVLACSLAWPADAHASLMSPEAEDAVATFLSWFILFVVPVGLIVVFWLVHILPEKIAHKRHHPQFEAIRTLCLLSLVFGGLLWPIAWLWAYTKPVGYKLAYGTDKHPDYFTDRDLVEPDAVTTDLRQRVAALEGRGIPDDEIEAIRADVTSLESRLAQRGAQTEVS
jgi:heme/copper-type cytochrome/quinol oxidase subunit 2